LNDAPKNDKFGFEIRRISASNQEFRHMESIVQGYPVPGNWRKPLEEEEGKGK
jgi:hypothetical protein